MIYDAFWTVRRKRAPRQVRKRRVVVSALVHGEDQDAAVSVRWVVYRSSGRLVDLDEFSAGERLSLYEAVRVCHRRRARA